MMKYNQPIREEMLEQAIILQERARRLEKEISLYPQGTIYEKLKGSKIYYYLILHVDGKYIHQYIRKEDIDVIKKQLAERQSKEKYKKKIENEAEDFKNIVQKKRYFPITDLAKNYLEEERQRSLRMLRTYREEEIKALSVSDAGNKAKYGSIAKNIEKSIDELNKILRIKYP